MPESSADRQRRYRRHKDGDHGLCVPGRCPALTPRDAGSVTSRHDDSPGVALGAAGLNLWREMTKQGALPPMQAVLLLEACRITDRLEKLDAKLRGEDREWLELDERDDGRMVFVIVDKALSEARQQATALKQIVAELRQAQGGSRQTSQKPRPGEVKPEGGAGGTLSDLTARIAQRGASSAG